MNLQMHFLPLLDLFLKSTAILAAGVVCLALARKASAANRHAIILAVFVALLLIPLTKLVAPRWSFAVEEMPAATVRVEVGAIAAGIDSSASRPGLPQSGSIAPGEAFLFAIPWKLVFVAIWLGGTAILLGRRVYIGFRLRALASSGLPIRDARMAALTQKLAADHGLRVDARESSSCRVPLVAGIFRPFVLLPIAAREWSEPEVASALCHEFGHVRRRDCMARLIADLAVALYWWNPLAWVLARRMRVAQEQACDDLVLTSGAAPDAYAAQLVEAVRSLQAGDLASNQALAMAQPSTLEVRVLSIMDPTRKRSGLRASGTLAGVAAVFGLLALSGAAQLEDARNVVNARPESGDRITGLQSKMHVMIGARILETLGESADLPEFLRGSGPVDLGDRNPEVIIGELQKANRVKTLAVPRVITPSGQKAVVALGQTYSYPSDWEKDAATGEWRVSKSETKDLGFSFEVTPRVQPDGAIELELAPKVVELTDVRDYDDPTTEGKPDPARVIPKGHRSQSVFSTRKVQSLVTVMSGRTIAIGGLDADKRRLVVLVTAEAVPPHVVREPDRKATDAPQTTAPPKAVATPKETAPKEETARKEVTAPKEVSAAKGESAPKEVIKDEKVIGARANPGKGGTDAPLDITADEFRANPAGGHTAKGNVRVTHRKAHMTGDEVTYDQASRTVTLVGNVKFVDEGKEVTAEKLSYRLDNGAISTEGPSKTKIKNVAPRSRRP